MWAQCLGQRHPLVQQPGTEASRPFHAVLSSAKSHGGRQQWGYGAFRWLLRLHPAPQDTATTFGKQPRKSSGNTNPPPGSSRSPGPDTPPPTLHPLAQGGRASTAWFALARPRGHCGSFPEFPAARPFTQPVHPRGTWGTRLEPLPSSPPTL